jgi:hypothetical protein
MLVEHDVCGFQIAMQYPSFVHGGKAGAELARYIDCFVLGKPSDTFEE